MTLPEPSAAGRFPPWSSRSSHQARRRALGITRPSARNIWFSAFRNTGSLIRISSNCSSSVAATGPTARPGTSGSSATTTRFSVIFCPPWPPDWANSGPKPTFEDRPRDSPAVTFSQKNRAVKQIFLGIGLALAYHRRIPTPKRLTSQRGRTCRDSTATPLGRTTAQGGSRRRMLRPGRTPVLSNSG